MNSELPQKFTIRVYGLLLHDGAVLLSRENIKGGIYTKFPGGGLEFGEGTLQCLQREFREEAGIKVEPATHFYTTEEYIRSAFNRQYQVMSIYYRINSHEIKNIPLGNPQQQEKLQRHGDQILFWKELNQLRPTDLDLPLDRQVAEKLKTAGG